MNILIKNKKIFSALYLMFILLFNSCEPEKKEYGSFTVYAKYSYIHYKNTVPDYLYTTWPGKPMEYIGQDWYKYTFQGQESAYITFNSNVEPKSEEEYRNKDGWYLNGLWFDSNPDSIITELTLNKTETTIKSGQSETLFAFSGNLTPSESLVQWSSSDSNIATVDTKGVVSAISVGTAYIKALTETGLKSVCKINVVDTDKNVTGINIDLVDVNILNGNSYRINYQIIPPDATAQMVSFISTNESVVKVTDGGLISTVATGNATVRLTLQNNSLIYSDCNITVTDQYEIIYNDANPVIKADFGNKSTIKYHIKNLGQKSIYLIKANKSKISPISATSTGQANNLEPTKSTFTRYQHIKSEEFNANPPPKLPDSQSGLSRSLSSIEPMKYIKGDSKKFWVENADGNFIEITSTLRGVGNDCMVWVADKNWGFNPNQINEDKVSEIIKKFDGTSSNNYNDGIHKLVTNVFGYEFGGEPTGDGGVDKTKEIQILVYDIDFDYSSTQSGGVCGFFWAKDYYSQSELDDYSSGLKSNNSEIFYIDANFTSIKPEVTYSTLSHEYQHMIHFNRKFIRYGLSSETWFNEMLSMVCEDMIIENLGLSTENSPTARLSQFNSQYYMSGVNSWLSGQDVLISYSTAFAFGAYLSRNYGGVNLIKNIIFNNTSNYDSITDGLAETGYNINFDTLFENYIKGIMYETAPVGSNIKTLNKEEINTSNGMTYRFKEINIWKIVQLLNKNKYGPVSLPKNIDLKPLGFSIHTDTTWENVSSDITIQLEKPESKNVDLYIVIK